MATVFKTFLNDDIATTRTLLHEAVPVSGGIVNGVSYNEGNSSETNVKNYTHQMFQSVYDYSYTKSSSNHIFDVTVGVNSNSAFQNTADDSGSKKQIIYNEFAQILAGHDIDGNIRSFDTDGNLTGAGGDKYEEVYVISIARLLNKDEVKKGSFYMKLNVQDPALEKSTGGARQEILISDEGAADDYKVNSPAGDYGILKCRTYKHYEGDWADATGGTTGKKVFTQTSPNEVYTLDYDSTDNTTGYFSEPLATAATGGLEGLDTKVGLIFYQAGIIVLSPYVFHTYATASAADAASATSDRGKLPTSINFNAGGGGGSDSYGNSLNPGATVMSGATDNVYKTLRESNIPSNCDFLRNRIHQIAFNNTTELNSTIYFCRVNHNDFNYSSNPTYLDSGEIRVKKVISDAPISYITSVGLYSANNELLAVAKLSEPLRKDPTNEMVLRVRLDY